jgi:VanZ family protein
VDAVPTTPSADDAKRQPQAASTGLGRLRLGMAILWTVVIMLLCWLPGPMVQELEHGSSWFKIPDLDKLVHAGIFVVFSILWARALISRRRFAWVALGGVVLAILTELVQNLPIVGRDGEVSDAITDFGGVLAGMVLAPLVEPVARFIETLITGRRLHT